MGHKFAQGNPTRVDVGRYYRLPDRKNQEEKKTEAPTGGPVVVRVVGVKKGDDGQYHRA